MKRLHLPSPPKWVFAVADQGVIAVTNLGLSVTFARVSGLGGLGLYSLLSVTMLASVGFVQTLVTDPWLASSKPEGRTFTPELRSLVVGSACVAAIPVLVVCIVARTPSQWYLAIVVAVLMVLQDCGRLACYKEDHSARALVSDAILAVGFAMGFLISLWLRHQSVLTTLTCWIFALALAISVNVGKLFGGPLSAGFGRWWHVVCRQLGLPLWQDSLAYFLSINGSTYALAAFASKEAVGGVRVVNTLYSPISMVFSGFSWWLVPLLARRGVDATRALRKRATVGLSSLAIILGAVVIAIGPWITPLVFGPQGQPSRSELLLGGLFSWCNATATAWMVSVKVFGRYQPIAWTRTLTGLLMIAAIGILPPLHNVAGYLGIVSVQSGVIAFMAWRTSHLIIRSRTRNATSN